MLKLKFSTLSRAGDTIIEVMIVLSVLGLALSISYATANRSLLNTRQAEENAQATRYVQAEIETLYDLASSPYALKSTDPGYGGDNDGNGLGQANIYSWNKIFCTVPGSGVLTDGASTSCQTYNGMYKLSVYYCDHYTGTDVYCLSTGSNPSVIAKTDTFVIRVTWPDVAGDGTDSVTQAYRIHPGEGA